jgi:hypothetical protein
MSEPQCKHHVRHVPLSANLARLFSECDPRPFTLNRLMARTRGRGLYLAMILLAIPFVSPIPLPGLSTAVGLAIAIMSARLALRLPPRLPRFLGDRELSRGRMRRLVRSSASFLRSLEKLAKPRHGEWLRWRSVRLVNAVILILLGLLLALPIPPVMPFTNSLPGWGIILMSLSLMEEDGHLIWAAYLMAVGTTLYLCFFSGLAIAGLHRLFDSWLAT